ncbi:hypothetical protein D3C71_1705760 [compost metagenome]
MQSLPDRPAKPGQHLLAEGLANRQENRLAEAALMATHGHLLLVCRIQQIAPRAGLPQSAETSFVSDDDERVDA